MKKIINDYATNKLTLAKVTEELVELLKSNGVLKENNTFIKDVHSRSEQGDLEIYPAVYLPHLKQSYINTSQIIVITRSTDIAIQHKQHFELIIFVVVAMDVSEEAQTYIRNFIKSLADEAYIQKLITKGAM